MPTLQIANLTQLPLNTTLMGCIKGAVDYYEMDTSVPALFGLTSHAFLINLHGTLCPSSPYVWNKEEFYRLLEGLGIRRSASVERKKGATEAEIQETQERVMEHLRAGNLCMLDYLEHQLVSGYDEKGFVFLRPWNGMSPTELPTLSFGTWEECLAKEGWVQFTLLEKSGLRRNFNEQLKDSLSVALSMFARPESFQVPGYRVGFGAWETWIAQVKKGAGAKHGHWWNASVWSECRLMAGDFFREADTLLPPGARKTAADLSAVYKEMGTLLFEAREKTLPAAEQVTRLEACQGREKQAVALLGQLAAAL
jgi:hypothetical protein